MKLKMMILAAILGAITSQAVASTLLGPKGKFSALFYRLEWEPGNACFKPMKPYSKDRYAWESYKHDAIRYLDCLKGAADSDARYASESVIEGYKKAADEFIEEVGRSY